jgi:hypothetical protein
MNHEGVRKRQREAQRREDGRLAALERERSKAEEEESRGEGRSRPVNRTPGHPRAASCAPSVRNQGGMR